MFSRRFLRIKVIKALYSHFKSGCDSMITSEKNLVGSIDKAYDLYFQMLRLVADVKVYAEERIELGRNKKLPTYSDLHPNLSFVENGVIAQIEESAALNARLEKAALGWNQYPELIKHLYTLMSESEYYKPTVMQATGPWWKTSTSRRYRTTICWSLSWRSSPSCGATT